MSHSYGSGRRRGPKLLLLVGFLALTVAIATAHREPASSYELSIYAATPETFWIGTYAALFVGVAVALVPDAGRTRVGALLLAGAAVVSVVALPVVRGYHFYGTADPLTHLGLVRDLSTGALDTFTFIYPGLHGLSVVLNRIGGYPLRRAVLVAIVVFAVVFVIFVAFTARAVSERAGALAVGAFSAFPFLPVNNVGFHLRAHTFSMATLFSALVIFLFVKYVTQPHDATHRTGLSRITGASPYGSLLVVAGVGAVLYHPQVATDLLVVFGIVCALQFLFRRRWPDNPIASHRTMYVPTALVGVFYAAWTLRTQWFYGTAGRHAVALLEFFVAGGLTGSSIASQGTSILAIGGSLGEMFVKLFAVNLLFGLLATFLVYLVITGRLDRSAGDTPALVTYLAAGSAGVVVLVVLYVLGAVADMAFRHLGLLSMLVAVLGAVAILELGEAVSRRTTPRRIRVGIAILFVLAIPMGLATAYQSPYIYKASQHVTEAQMDGYSFALDQADDTDVPMIGIRVEPRRFGDAIRGTAASSDNRRLVPGGDLDRLGDSVDSGYVVVSSSDRQREVVAYRGLRHTNDEFRSLDAQAGVNRVHSTGETSLYLVG